MSVDDTASPTPRSDTRSEAVVRAVANARDADPTDLEPLYNAVDPDALDALFTDGHADDRIVFRYCGHEVTVYADGRVLVDERHDGPRLEPTIDE